MSEKPLPQHTLRAGEILLHITPEGYTVLYNKTYKNFHAIKGNDITSELIAKTQDALEELLEKERKKPKKKFKALPVILMGSDIVGRITSRVKGSENSFVWFSYKSEHQSRPSASQYALMSSRIVGYGVENKREPRFAKQTPKNIKILEEITAKQAEIMMLGREQKALRKSYEAQVTWDDVDAQEQ